MLYRQVRRRAATCAAARTHTSASAAPKLRLTNGPCGIGAPCAFLHGAAHAASRGDLIPGDGPHLGGRVRSRLCRDVRRGQNESTDNCDRCLHRFSPLRVARILNVSVHRLMSMRALKDRSVTEIIPTDCAHHTIVNRPLDSFTCRAGHDVCRSGESSLSGT